MSARRVNQPPSMEDLGKAALPPSFGDLSQQASAPPSFGNLSQRPGSALSIPGSQPDVKPSAGDVLRIFNRGKRQPTGLTSPEEKIHQPQPSGTPNAIANTDWICETIGGLQKELHNHKDDYRLEVDNLRNELHAAVEAMKSELLAAMKINTKQSMNMASKEELKEMSKILQKDSQMVSSRLNEMTTDVQKSLNGYTLSLSQESDNFRKQENQWHIFDRRLSNLEQSSGRPFQPQADIGGSMEACLPQSANSMLEQLKRDADILPASILSSEAPRQHRDALASTWDGAGGRLPTLDKATMEGMMEARSEFMGAMTRTPLTGVKEAGVDTLDASGSGLPVSSNRSQPTGVQAQDRLAETWPGRSESPRNAWGARPESPRQVWASDLPPSPRSKSKS